MISTRTLTLLGSLSLICACSMDPTHVEEDFGNSVRQMVSAQIMYPEVAADPSADPVDSMDGVAAATSMDDYREEFKRENQQSQTVGFGLRR